MTAGRGPAAAVGACLVVASAVYGAWGFSSGVRYALGTADARAGRLARALARLEGSAWGSDRIEGTWLRGEVRLGLWDAAFAAGGVGAARRALLDAAARDYVAALRAAPGSGWAIAGLASAYGRAEREAAAGRSLDLGALDAGPWTKIGREGRIGLGLRALAVAREPNVAARHDERVLDLIAAGCEREAEAAIAEAARVLPCFGDHAGFRLDVVPRPFVETFARASREALGATPLLRRQRHLLCMGQLERVLGRYEAAHADLVAAAAEPGEAQERAEAQYWLGMVASDLGRADEALAAFTRASEFPSFRRASATARAHVLESQGRKREALEALAEARREAPRDPEVLVAYAKAAVEAGERPAALEALRWAVLVRPDAAAAWTALVETLLSGGDVAEANTAIDGMTRALGESEQTRRLRAAAAAAGTR